MQWAEALSTFQEVARIHSHPVVTFNVGLCERALGRYTRARATFARVLEASQQGNVVGAVVAEASDYEREIDGLLVHLRLTLSPQPGTHLSVDGRSLSADGPARYVAGLAQDGADDRPLESTFEIVLDPGTHIFHASREGYTDVVLNRSFSPAQNGDLQIDLERLPARVHVASSVERATVLMNGLLIGETPLDATRPPGRYRLEVRRPGFLPYETTVSLDAGGRADLTARLSPVSMPMTSKWWFWAGSVAIVATGALVTYALTRPTPEPPPYNGGGAGWVAAVR